MRAAPDADELRAAVLGGAAVRCGLPTSVPLRGGGTAVLDLAAAAAGSADPWTIVCRPLPGVAVLETAAAAGGSVAGISVSMADLGRFLAAVDFGRAAAADPHDALADGMRAAAGRAASGCADVMLRARLLDAVDGWGAVLGRLVDHDASHGDLHDASDPAVTCRVLVVRCPSTGRTYVLRVPAQCATAREARLWTLHLDHSPEIET